MSMALRVSPEISTPLKDVKRPTISPNPKNVPVSVRFYGRQLTRGSLIKLASKGTVLNSAGVTKTRFFVTKGGFPKCGKLVS
jgi:hypothetical protein